jgi:hypothetical protein
MSVYDSTRGMVLNLSDPFAAEELWSRKSYQIAANEFPF